MKLFKVTVLFALMSSFSLSYADTLKDVISDINDGAKLQYTLMSHADLLSKNLKKELKDDRDAIVISNKLINTMLDFAVKDYEGKGSWYSDTIGKNWLYNLDTEDFVRISKSSAEYQQKFEDTSNLDEVLSSAQGKAKEIQDTYNELVKLSKERLQIFDGVLTNSHVGYLNKEIKLFKVEASILKESNEIKLKFTNNMTPPFAVKSAKLKFFIKSPNNDASNRVIELNYPFLREIKNGSSIEEIIGCGKQCSAAINEGTEPTIEVVVESIIFTDGPESYQFSTKTYDYEEALAAYNRRAELADIEKKIVEAQQKLDNLLGISSEQATTEQDSSNANEEKQTDK